MFLSDLKEGINLLKIQYPNLIETVNHELINNEISKITITTKKNINQRYLIIKLRQFFEVLLGESFNKIIPIKPYKTQYESNLIEFSFKSSNMYKFNSTFIDYIKKDKGEEYIKGELKDNKTKNKSIIKQKTIELLSRINSNSMIMGYHIFKETKNHYIYQINKSSSADLTLFTEIVEIDKKTFNQVYSIFYKDLKNSLQNNLDNRNVHYISLVLNKKIEPLKRLSKLDKFYNDSIFESKDEFLIQVLENQLEYEII